jgi:hypothetical protein
MRIAGIPANAENARAQVLEQLPEGRVGLSQADDVAEVSRVN